MTLYKIEDIIPRTEREETLARYICEIDRVDPESRTTGLGVLLPSGFEYKLWQIRVPKARAIIEWGENIYASETN